MTTRRPLSLAALMVSAALLAAGCGSSDSDEPSAADARAAYQSIRTQIVGLGGSIGEEITNARNETDAQLTSAFEQLSARGQAAIERLQQLDVPDELADERQALGDALAEGTQDLEDIARAAEASDPAAARRAVQRLIVDSQTIRKARDGFERALDDAAQQ